MDDRERYRLQMARDIAKLMQHRSLRDALPPLRPDGSIPFVVGLPEDTLRSIAEKVTTLGGDAHLIVPSKPDRDDSLRLQILRYSGEHKEITDLDESHECAVDENSTLAMLMQHIEVGQALTYYTYDSETVIRFINDSVQPIPV